MAAKVKTTIAMPRYTYWAEERELSLMFLKNTCEASRGPTTTLISCTAWAKLRRISEYLGGQHTNKTLIISERWEWADALAWAFSVPAGYGFAAASRFPRPDLMMKDAPQNPYPPRRLELASASRHQDKKNKNDNKRNDHTPNGLFIAAGQKKSAPMPYNVSPRIKVALYLNFLCTQPPYVKHAMGYALSSPPPTKSHYSFVADMDMGMREPLTRISYLQTRRPPPRDVESGLEMLIQDIEETVSESLTSGTPLARSLSIGGGGGGGGGGETQYPEEEQYCNNANGSSDCRSVRSEALVTMSSRARNASTKKNSPCIPFTRMPLFQSCAAVAFL